MLSRRTAAYSLTRTSCQQHPVGIHQFRGLQNNIQRSGLIGRRAKSTETGNEDSGHIDAGPHEGIFFIESTINAPVL